MQLNTLSKSRGRQGSKKRLGRGNGSGRGTFCTRGCKGQKARTGYSRKPWFEGGQTPLIQKLPKSKGFRNPNKIDYVGVNLASLERIEGTEVTIESLYNAGLISNKKAHVKILGSGDAAQGYTVKVHAITKSAQEKLEGKGGKVELLKK